MQSGVVIREGVDVEFVVVTGPPCSGKSTWIATHSDGADVFAREGLDNDPKTVARERAAFVAAHSGRDGSCLVESCRFPALDVASGDVVTHVRMEADERTCLERLESSDRSDKGRWREVIGDYFSEPGPARGPFHTDTSPHGDEGPHGPESEEPMPDETTPATEGTGQPKPEPQGTETDWKAEARKWEKRAKENKGLADELQRQIDAADAKGREAEAKDQRASEALEELRKENRSLRASIERERKVREVAASKGVDPDVLVRMAGDTDEEIAANVDLLTRSNKRRWPVVPDDGATKAPRMTKEEILAIKNPKEQLKAALENPGVL